MRVKEGEEAELEKEFQKNYLLGQSVGLDEAATFLMDQAAYAFKTDKEDNARLLKALAKEIQKRADDRYKHPDPFKEK